MDKSKLKSYALLMAYDLPKMFEQHADFIKEYGEMGYIPSYEQILLNFKKIRSNPIDIYSWTPDWEEICESLYLQLKFISRMSVIDSGSIILLINKYKIESGNIDLKALSNRIVFIINKYYYLKLFFLKIYNNYKNFRKYHRDIEFGTEKFNEIILKRINKGRIALSSERTHAEIKSYFNGLKKNKAATYEFIINNLPFDFLEEINTSNKNKISLFFQKGLAREMLFYLNLTKMSVTQKQLILGFSFSFCEYIYKPKEFTQKKMAKDKYYEFVFSDYEEFLRTEGYNVHKSL